MFLVDEHTKRNRRFICQNCPQQRKDFKLFGFTIFKNEKQCKICKCDIDLKTMLNDSECPLKKW